MIVNSGGVAGQAAPAMSLLSPPQAQKSRPSTKIGVIVVVIVAEITSLIRGSFAVNLPHLQGREHVSSAMDDVGMLVPDIPSFVEGVQDATPPPAMLDKARHQSKP